MPGARRVLSVFDAVDIEAVRTIDEAALTPFAQVGSAPEIMPYVGD